MLQVQPAAKNVSSTQTAGCQDAVQAAKQGNPSSTAAAVTCLSLQASKAAYEGDCGTSQSSAAEAKTLATVLSQKIVGPSSTGISNATYAAVLGGLSAAQAAASLPPCAKRAATTTATLERSSAFCTSADASARSSGSPTDEATVALCYMALAAAASAAKNCAAASLAAAAAANSASISRVRAQNEKVVTAKTQAQESALFATTAAATASSAASSCNAVLSAIAGKCEAAAIDSNATALAAAEAMRDVAKINNKNITAVAQTFGEFTKRAADVAAKNVAACEESVVEASTGENTGKAPGKTATPTAKMSAAKPVNGAGDGKITVPPPKTAAPMAKQPVAVPEMPLPKATAPIG